MTKSEPRSRRARSERLSKRDWVTAALRQLGAGGIASVGVESLARILGVTKGSFYWHFKDRDALLIEMLRHWQDSSTSRIGEFVREQISDPRERLSFLMKLASEDRDDVPGGAIEHAIREWARNSELARRTLSEVDSERLTVISEIYANMGMSRSRASAAALLALSHLIGVNVIHRDVGLQAFRSQRETCLDFLLQLPDRMETSSRQGE